MGLNYANLPGVKITKLDGNLTVTQSNIAPRIAIIGTAEKGVADTGFNVSTSKLAKAEFGTGGTLIRGMFEAISQGATRILLYRIGAKAATLVGIGKETEAEAGGFSVETIEKDSTVGADYAMYYIDSSARLVVKRNSDDVIVFDNDLDDPIDLGEVIVSGYRALSGGPDVGSPSSFVDLEDVTGTGITYSAGSNGTSLSKMELYEKLYVAYRHLMEFDFDVIVPMDVFLDDLNCVNQGNPKGAQKPVIPSGQTYPTPRSFVPGVNVDSLGKLYVEDYKGKSYFWWWDGEGTFTEAQVYPSIGEASETKKIDGTSLTGDDFHEVNFGYQLGRFLYSYSENIVDATGVIGVLPPDSNSLDDRAVWLGKAPTLTINTQTGEEYIASALDDGNGLLGNKFLAGMYEHRSGKKGGGFILTDSEFFDGEELLDDNEVPIDLGKYISVVVDTPILRNTWLSSGYLGSFAACYGGFYLNRIPQSAPTNKVVSNVIVYYKQGLPAIDDLVGAGYVVLRNKTAGVVVVDAPTAAMPLSDWKRLSTVRIVKSLIDGVRTVVEPYIGEGTSSGIRAAIKTSVEKVLQGAVKSGALQRYNPFEIIQTPTMEVQGKMEIPLTVVPAFEIREISFPISVSKSS